MDDETLRRLSLSFSLIGILGLFLLSCFFKPLEVSPSEIDESLIGKTITTSGYVAKLRRHEDGHVFLKLENKSKIDVVIFANVARKNEAILKELKRGDAIKVTGKVVEYRDRLEIVASEIEVLVFKTSLKNLSHER